MPFHRDPYDRLTWKILLSSHLLKRPTPQHHRPKSQYLQWIPKAGINPSKPYFIQDKVIYYRALTTGRLWFDLWSYAKLLENSKLALVCCSDEWRGWVSSNSPNSESCTFHQLNQLTIWCQVLVSLNKIWSCLIFIKLYLTLALNCAHRK